MAIKCISKNCPFADTNPDNCHFIDCCDFAVVQPTNADRIRSMSDEELAKMLTVWKGAFTCFECRETGDWECSMKCDERCLDWLQQPSKGE